MSEAALFTIARKLSLYTFAAVCLLQFSSGEPSTAERLAPSLPFEAEHLTLIDEVDLGAETPGHRFEAYPNEGIVKRTSLWGRRALTLPNDTDAPDRYVAVRLGEGKGLKASVQYVLQVEYPEDVARSMVIFNTGNETTRGFHTGAAVGDALRMPYVWGNAESLNIPLSGKWETWTSVFELHQRYSSQKRQSKPTLSPPDGFTVVLAHFNHANAPVSGGLAVGRVRLFAAPRRETLELPIKRPPAGLPQRHLFWREEMSDGSALSQFDKRKYLDWYAAKVRLMKFLGMDTFSKDLLEFGHNQGWDSSRYGGTNWVNQNKRPQMWSNIVSLAGKMKVNVLPMYEYCGSIGQTKLSLGLQKRCETLSLAKRGPKGRDDYTHIHWSEKGNADVTDPDTVEDLRKILEITIADEAKKARILGAWIRPRNSGMPVSFSERCRKLFATDTGRKEAPSRDELKKDRQLYDAYLNWWHDKRKQFFVAIRDYLRKPSVLGPEAVVIFTGDPSEPGRVLDGGYIVSDGPKRLPGARIISPEAVLSKRLGWKALTGPRGTWGGWEWQHSIPRLDPLRYKDTPGVMLSMAFNRLFTVADSKALDAFHAPDGLALLRHYPLNENAAFSPKGGNRPLGYFITDMERAGPYCMLAEARALANGDPRFIGYLAAGSFQRGFPEYVRAFNQAFLALPALPGKIVKDAAANQDVRVRAIATPTHGTWYAIVNTGLKDAANVAINLNAEKLTDYLTGKALKSAERTVSLYPGQVLVWHSK